MKSESDIRKVLAWLRQLRQHNDRPWFQQHRAEYDALRTAWEHDMARLIDKVGEFDPATRGLDVKLCVYRIYRDVRFSADKRPYKDYFSGVVSQGGRHTQRSCNYVHFEPDNVMVGGGVWLPTKPVLQQLRALIDAEREEFLHIVHEPELGRRGYHWECQSLKKVPKGYDPADPMAEFLKMKEFLLVKRPPENYFDVPDWVEPVAADLRALQPLHNFLNYVFEP